MAVIDTDYLVVGGGAAGMAFTDSLLTESDADVVMVERRHRPGGHWNDAYPFVRLHQPSASYGVNSMLLGNDTIDEHGRNAGLYERASGAEILAYFQRVLDDRFLPSGRVRFFGMHDYVGDFAGEHRVVSRLTGDVVDVAVRRRVVDATYLETAIPATHTPQFDVDAGAQVIAVNGLPDVTDAPSGFTIMGSGKTGMDACIWLLDNGVAPDAIRWIRPREAWLLDRVYFQPQQLVTSLFEGLALASEAAAEAEDVDDLFRRLEASRQLRRLDDSVEPTMYHCATVSDDEIESLQSIEQVIRQGRVRRIGTGTVEMDAGTIPSDPAHVYVDCTAAGLHVQPARPIFDGPRITLQQVRTCQPPFNAALIAFVETMADDDRERNRLCPPNPYPNAARDWISNQVISRGAQDVWTQHPDINAWSERSRLNIARGALDHVDDPAMQSAVGRFLTFSGPANEKLQGFLDGPT